jgi:uncharacterized protein (TIGR02145 family)
MVPEKLNRIITLSIICISLFSCKTEQVILHGDITGLVTDATTSEPIQAARVRLNPSNDSINTGNNGTYLLKNITPGDYEIQVSKFAYKNSSKNIEVIAAQTDIVNFVLNGIPIPFFSDTILNFELDLTSLPFTISNSGKKKLTYISATSQDWITVYPSSGDVIEDETDTIRVTINKTGLSDNILYNETIRIISDFGTNIINVIVNGFRYEGQTYELVKIGTQTWMAENLNVGKLLSNIQTDQRDNGIHEKYCYVNKDIYCKTYGGIYYWGEAMQYHPSDTGIIGTTQGICPRGWHIPTEKEWLTLTDYLGGKMIAGGKLKETGTIHWESPNTAATNETGFTALPGGYIDYGRPGWVLVLGSYAIDSVAGFWTATQPDNAIPDELGYSHGFHLELSYDNSSLIMAYETKKDFSVRCIKDPDK